MSVKTIAAILVVAGVTGAGVGYLQRNPGALSSAGSQLMAFREKPGSRTQSGPSPAWTEGYRLCRRDFSAVMTGKTPTRRNDSCRCFADAYGTWTTLSRDLGKPMIYLKLVEVHARRGVQLQSRTTYSSNNRLSPHERNVRLSQSRDIAGQLQRNADRIIAAGGKDLLDNHPMRAMLMNFRIRMLFAHCDIVDM
ncbi:hypothetical protein [Oricola sp.]|uniref:hypothetical protein n=1 Tax=Oricola sp. TaxID=1979950 RepID=UPI0025E452B4|nr:hypothetical protein [Oricola sp.]MCI5075839.1 hypothetical protein [Oricola sp.]